MSPFSNQPHLHLQWLLVASMLAIGQLKETTGIEPEEVATIAIAAANGGTSDLGTPSVEMRLLAIGLEKTVVEAAWTLGIAANRIAETPFGTDGGAPE